MTEPLPSLGTGFSRVSLADLRPHPRNYRRHPEDQLAHLEASLKEHGVYRNVVIAQDGTILAGHGVVEAARRAGLAEILVCRLPLASEDPKALRVLAADNTVSGFAEDDDRALADLLKEVGTETPEGLLGTGYDEAALAALVLVTRPEAEIADAADAAAWVGLPGFEEAGTALKLVVTFADAEARLVFLGTLGVGVEACRRRKGEGWAIYWPPRGRRPPGFARFVEAPGQAPPEGGPAP